MTPEHAAFLRAICASPHDDTPRLVFADYLEETEHPEHVARAHFIRAQIAMSQFPPGSIEHDTAAGVAERCLDMFGENWAWDYPKWFQNECQFEYRRGFPEVLTAPSTRILHDAAELGTVTPVTDLRFDETFVGLRAFDRLPQLEHVSTLRLGPRLPGLVTNLEMEPTDDVTATPIPVVEFHSLFRELLSCPHLSAVHTLDLSQNQLTSDWAVRFTSALPSAAFANSLRELDLSMNFHLTDAAANVFATTPAFDGLTRLRLKDTQITRSGAAMLRRRFGNRVEV
jgi:uncharacterized protein (TIGR02996 family)